MGLEGIYILECDNSKLVLTIDGQPGVGAAVSCIPVGAGAPTPVDLRPHPDGGYQIIPTNVPHMPGGLLIAAPAQQPYDVVLFPMGAPGEVVMRWSIDPDGDLHVIHPAPGEPLQGKYWTTDVQEDPMRVRLEELKDKPTQKWKLIPANN
ncbi:unnamed protein product [Rhizoctonia solani]|uniref:Uncharacterized protein n=1 Tax=Rhizoctonia solani TaxID=456999 RepID=A0A8H3B2R5_9AGAM|nr:unnamed protein product [Rhizoctonia solani]CAE6517077.1 unnamed protein product [Rhizoctonia solani]